MAHVHPLGDGDDDGASPSTGVRAPGQDKSRDPVVQATAGPRRSAAEARLATHDAHAPRRCASCPSCAGSRCRATGKTSTATSTCSTTCACTTSRPCRCSRRSASTRTGCGASGSGCSTSSTTSGTSTRSTSATRSRRTLRFAVRNAKRTQGVLFLVDATVGRLASAIEFVSTAANLDTRRTVALPEVVAARLDALIRDQVGAGLGAAAMRGDVDLTRRSSVLKATRRAFRLAVVPGGTPGGRGRPRAALAPPSLIEGG